MGHVTLTVKEGETPRMPDGGWGWVVVAASLGIHLIQDGIAFSFGVLFVEFTREFQASKSSSSWVGSLFISVPLITGPIMSILVDKYGCRRMTLVAGTVSATGFILSYFAESIVVMYFTFGIIAGTGLGLTYITAIVSVAFWFDKKRNLAVGLGACGTGIGTIVYAPFTNYLIQEFGWRWSLILLAGTLLNICVGGAVMRDPDWLIKQKRQAKLDSSSSVSTNSQKIDLEAIRELLKNGQNPEGLVASNHQASDGQHRSVLDLPTFIKQKEKLPEEVLQNLREDEHLYKIVLRNYPSLLDNSPLKTKDAGHQMSRTPAIEPLISSQKNLANPENYFKRMMFPRRSIVYHEVIMNRNKNNLSASSCPNIYKGSVVTLAAEDDEHWYTGIIQLFMLFDELHYLLVSISTVILFAWFMTPYFYLVDHMVASGYTEGEGSLVLSVIGIANTIGMVGLGYLGDRSWTSVSKMYAITIVLCGAACSFLYIFTMDYLLLNVFSGLYGIFLASTFVFTPIMMMELLPMVTFTKAFGLQLLCQGVGHLVGPPIAAYFADVTGSWAMAFHVSAVWIVVAGVCILAVPYTKNRKLFGSGLTEKEKEANAASSVE